MDFSYWSALTPPMASAGEIQQRRNAEMLQAMQLVQQQQNLQLKQANDAKQIQTEINVAQQATRDALYKNSQLRRQKDIDDHRNWHDEFSGWNDIQNVLKEAGSIQNARTNYNLDYLISEYKHKVNTPSSDPSQGNPILDRLKINEAAITAYNTQFNSAESIGKIMNGDHERYQQWVRGEADIFRFAGARGDYLKNMEEQYGIDDNITLDQVFTQNQIAIYSDFARDKELTADEAMRVDPYEVKSWLAKELKWASQGGQDLFGGKAVYGTQNINTTFTTELNEGIMGVDATGMVTTDDWFDLRENNVSYVDLFNESGAWVAFDRLGGYDPNKTARDTRSWLDLDPDTEKSGIKDWLNVGKGYHIISSGAIFANDKRMENDVISAIIGDNTEVEGGAFWDESRRTVHNMSTVGMYNENGHQITDRDVTNRGKSWVGHTLMPSEDENVWWWEEPAQVDMDYVSSHIAYKIVDKDGNSMLLADVGSDSDFNKMKEVYKGQKIHPVMVAQFVDRDAATKDDFKYMEINTSNPRVAEALNKVVDSESLSKIRTQEIGLEKESKLQARVEAQKEATRQKLAIQMAAGNTENLQVIANTYDQTMTIGLKVAGVKTNKIEESMPLIMSNLYVDSQRERTYPHTFNDGTVVNSPGEYMAITARMIRKSLSDGNDGGLKEAINDGSSAYAMWLKRRYNKKEYNDIMKGTKDWSKYFNG